MGTTQKGAMTILLALLARLVPSAGAPSAADAEENDPTKAGDAASVASKLPPGFEAFQVKTSQIKTSAGIVVSGVVTASGPPVLQKGLRCGSY